MTSLNRLTTLDRVKDWVGSTTSNDDVQLTRLIDEISRFILSYLQRPTLFQNTFNNVYEGVGQRSQILRHWPVTSVALLTIDNIIIPAATGLQDAGYMLEPWDGFPPGGPQAIYLRGYTFVRGMGNINVVYTAGFVVSNEPQTVPTSSNYTLAVNAPHGVCGADQGVTYANGVPLVKVISSPAHGQYTYDNGIYGFSAADAGVAVLISYSYVPADIEHACMEMVGERYRYKSHIGESSKNLGKMESIAYSQKDMPDFIRTLLQPYRRVILG